MSCLPLCTAGLNPWVDGSTRMNYCIYPCMIFSTVFFSVVDFRTQSELAIENPKLRISYSKFRGRRQSSPANSLTAIKSTGIYGQMDMDYGKRDAIRYSKCKIFKIFLLSKLLSLVSLVYFYSFFQIFIFLRATFTKTDCLSV